MTAPRSTCWRLTGQQVCQKPRFSGPRSPLKSFGHLLGRSEGIVSTRYHPIVFALAEGVGAAGLSFDPYYDQKLAGVFRTFDCEEAVFSLGDSIDACTVLDTVQGMQVVGDVDLYDRVVGPFRTALMNRAPR